MIRCRFNELCEYLKTKKELLAFNDEQFDSEFVGLTVYPGGGNETTEGYHIANFAYDGLIYIERMPGQTLALLAMLVRAWLDEHDDLRDQYKLQNPVIDTVTLDESYLDVLINTAFVDEIHVIPSETGAIDWQDLKFDIGDFVYDIAESGTVNDAPVEP